MLDVFASPEAWASLATLAALEVVLGIDNVIFLSLVSARLPKAKQRPARQIGLALALVMRVVLLFLMTAIAELGEPFATVLGHPTSWRDVILGVGGLFLIYKGTVEIHATVEGDEHGAEAAAKPLSFSSAIVQIVLLDIVFSLDSVITAVGLGSHFEVMVAAVVIAIVVMLVAAEPVSAFVQRHPTVKMLALSFLLLIGVALVADAMGNHIRANTSTSRSPSRCSSSR